MGKKPALYMVFLGVVFIAILAGCQLSAITSGPDGGFSIHLSVPSINSGGSAGLASSRYLAGNDGTVSVTISRNDSTGARIFNRDLSVQTAADGSNSASVTASNIPTDTPLRIVARMTDSAGVAYLQTQKDFVVLSGASQDMGLSLAPNPDYPGLADLSGLSTSLVVPAKGVRMLSFVADDTFLNIYSQLHWADDAGALSVAVMDSQGIVPSSVVTVGVVRGVVFKPQAAGLHYCVYSNTSDADVDLGVPAFTKNVAAAVFDTQGGSSIDTLVVYPGTSIPAPPAPTKANFGFGGWYSDAACTAGNEVTFPYTVNTLVTLHAKWYSLPVVGITFSLGNPAYQGLVFPTTGTTWPQNSTITVEFTCSNTAVNTDGTYWKWYVDGVQVYSQSSGRLNAHIFAFTPSDYGVGEHVLSASVLYQTVTYSGDMKFTITPSQTQTWSITYSAAGADAGSAPVDPASYASGDNATVLGNTLGLGRTNAVFLGWTMSPSGIGDILAPGSSLMLASDVTLYPAWLVMLPVPAGSFQRDASSTNISTQSAFLMGETEVTKGEFDRIMGTSNGAGQYPVGQVSVYDAVVFCNRLSEYAGLEPVYAIKGSTNPDDWGSIPRSANDPEWDAMICNREATGFRLPTEMEWAWAAMGADRSSPGAINTSGYLKEFAGDPNPTSSGDDPAPYGIFTPSGDSEISAIPVKTLLPNELGLYDMSGNVYEYVQDLTGNLPNGTLVNYCKETSTSAPSALTHYQKGGCSKHQETEFPPMDRSRGMWESYINYYDDFGFRVVRKAASSTYVPRSGLLAEWLLNSISGVNDTSGNDLSTDSVGNLAPATDHRGIASEAITLGSTLVGASLGYNPQLAMAGNATQSISFWFRTTAGFLPTGSIVFMFGQNALNTSEIDYAMGLYGNDLVAYVSEHNISSCTASTPVANDTWYHVVRTYDGSYLKLYLNGVLKASTLVPSGFLSLPPASASVTSAFSLNSNTTYPGALDDLRIYNRVLGAAEIQNLYQK